ncbi:MAG: M48 family metalloprotease [Desulfobacteraceae bacterium]|nr:M48 family metalloprotease [Desulfobacteraceae bacterium]
MFSNFIYFIIALITLSLYQPTAKPPLSLFEALAGFSGLAILYAIHTRHRFNSLANRVGTETLRMLDQRFSNLVTQHSILALAVFAADIWIMELPSYLSPLRFFVLFPMLKDLFFLMIFVGYLTIVWYYSYDAQAVIYRSDISRKAYVYSNFAFSVPVLLPWAILSGISDLLQLLPFETFKRILNSNYGQITYFLIFLVVAAVFAPVLIQRFWNCRPLEAGLFRQRIEALCQRAGVHYADIVYWPIFGGRMITAAVMGLIGRFRYIMVTEALLRLLTPDEIDQVIAHEIGHVKRRHLQLYLMFFIGFMLISYMIFPLSLALLFFIKPVLNLILVFKLNPNALISPLQSTLLVFAIIVYFRYAFGFFIRNFERQADLFVFRIFPSALPLISTFDKIAASSGQPTDKPNWHHFSIQERVDYLKHCEADPSWITRHDRKVRLSIFGFIVGFALLAVGVFQLNQMMFGHGQRNITAETIEAYLSKKQPKTSSDALLYGMLGNFYLENKRPAEAVKSYEQALLIDFNNPELLNNLAWILATSDDKSLRDEPRALELAQRAIELEKSPYIWDTLAEALFANGRIKEAIAAEKEALAMNPDDRKIYEKQLEKFKEGLKGEPER